MADDLEAASKRVKKRKVKKVKESATEIAAWEARISNYLKLRKYILKKSDKLWIDILIFIIFAQNCSPPNLYHLWNFICTFYQTFIVSEVLHILWTSKNKVPIQSQNILFSRCVNYQRYLLNVAQVNSRLHCLIE